MTRTTHRAERARSRRAFTLTATLFALGLAAPAALADHGPRRADHRGTSTHHVITHHDNDRGGTLWIGSNRFLLSDHDDAIETLAGELRRAGYRVTRCDDELTISDRDRLGGIRFTSGSLRTTITAVDRCTVRVRFERAVCEPVVVRPVVKPIVRPVIVRSPIICKPPRPHHDRGREGRTVISIRW